MGINMYSEVDNSKCDKHIIHILFDHSFTFG